MGIKGRRRTSIARAYEADPSATYIQEKQQQPLVHATAESNQQEQLSSSSELAPSTRPRVVSCMRKKWREGVIAILRYSDSSRYEGQTSESDDLAIVLRHGKGVYVTHNGHVFDGEWVHGVFQGWVPSEYFCTHAELQFALAVWNCLESNGRH